MLKKKIVTGIGGGALIAALVGIVPQCWQSWLDYRKDVMAMEQSAEQKHRRELCAASGGKWWRGECLEVFGPEEE